MATRTMGADFTRHPACDGRPPAAQPINVSEKGYAFILVLILLTLGSLLLTPTLSLAISALKSKQINTSILMEQYARDGAVEYALWKLQYDGVTSELTTEDDTLQYAVVLNGVSTNVSLVMRVESDLSGNALAHPGFKVFPWSEVSPTTASPGVPTIFNFTINLQRLHPYKTGEIDEVWDQLPPGFTYLSGSSEFEGSPVGDPIVETDSNIETLHWLFQPKVTFDVYGQLKSLTFQATATLSNDTRYCNEVALKPNDERSGRTGFVTVGLPASTGCAGGKVPVVVVPDPYILPPNSTTTVTFSLDYTNQDVGPHWIDQIIAVLAPGFTYVAGSSG